MVATVRLIRSLIIVRTAWHHALIVGRNTKVAPWKANIAHFLRIRAKRPATRGWCRGEIRARRNDRVRCNAVFDPIDQGRQRIELIGRGPSTTMTHVRNEEQPRELHGVREATIPCRHFLVILDCAGCRRARVAQSVVPYDLSVPLFKFCYVEGCRVGDHGRPVVQTSDVGVEVEAQRVESGIGWRDPSISDLTKSQAKIPRGRSWRSYLPRRKAGWSHVTAIIGITARSIVDMIFDHAASR